MTAAFLAGVGSGAQVNHGVGLRQQLKTVRAAHSDILAAFAVKKGPSVPRTRNVRARLPRFSGCRSGPLPKSVQLDRKPKHRDLRYNKRLDPAGENQQGDGATARAHRRTENVPPDAKLP